ncbi:flagellar basal body-associated FliL family protein [Paracoccus ravus]|uniref:flagellar basal body-associated FliL family protein n=1 Tax=Paracoccus ravus TaxID=2447760 RepID=UPI00106E4ABE|nr:flagellar basal body-associated FliL family protein [Paracoccus ravus]
MTETGEAPLGTGRRRSQILALVAVAAVAGVLGLLAPLLGGGTAQSSSQAEASRSEIQLLEIGQITVRLRSNLAGSESVAKHLVLNTLIEYDPAQLGPQEKGLEQAQHRIRDGFIEYLSGLTEAEIRGSSGMSRLRADLLRRARASAGNDAAQKVLIHDFIVQ